MKCRPGFFRRGQLRWAALLVGSALAAGLVHPVAAGADTVSDKRAQAAQIASKLNADNRRIDQLSEQFDGARLHQQEVEGQLSAAQADLARTDGQARVVLAQLRGVAVGAYVRSGQPLALRLADAQDMALATVGRTYEDLAAGDEQDVLDSVRTLRATLATEKAQLEAAGRDARAAAATVAQAQQAAQGAVAGEQALLSQVNGQLAALVAQAQAQQQAQLAAQVQADLAARAQQVAARPQRVVALVASASPLLPRAAPGPALPAPARPPSPGPPPGAAPPPSSRAGIAVQTAEAQLGKPYQYGAAGPGSFDCSGLTMYAWAAAGVGLAHYTGAQYAETTHIPLSALQPGDLVFFYSDLSHVGIYIGGGMMIHAPHTGTVVSYASIYAMGTTDIVAGRVG